MTTFRWIVTVSYAAFIFALSSFSWSNAPSFKHADKGMHALLYFGLGGLLVWALRMTKLRTKQSLLFVAFVCAVVYGLSDEIHQLFVPGRQFSMYDLLADAVGAAIGIATAWYMALHMRKEKVAIKND